MTDKWESASEGEDSCLHPYDAWPECEEFYDLMQTYRHMPIAEPIAVKKAYEEVKAWLRDHSVRGHEGEVTSDPRD